MGIWEVGPRWLIRDEANNSQISNDYMTQEFLRNQQPKVEIPLVEEMRILSAPTDKVIVTLMSRAQGLGLDKVWNTLTYEQGVSYRNQLGAAIKALRKFTSPVAKKVDGSVMNDAIIGTCLRRAAPTYKKMGRTTDEWFENIGPELRAGLSNIHQTKDRAVIEEKFQELKRNFPKSEPYVLTHGDLNFSNIIVKDDKIEAIIDWEYAGYLPWWVEQYLSLEYGHYQFVEPLWAEIGVEMDAATFKTKVKEPVEEVMRVWAYAHEFITHDHDTPSPSWYRPNFCECKPFSGQIMWHDLGNVPEHNFSDPLLD